MSGVEALVIGAVIGGGTNLLTNFINPLLKSIRRAVRCGDECRKLEETVESIKRTVEHVQSQFEELQRYDWKAAHDLQVGQSEVVKTLESELHLASIDVHDFDSANRFAKAVGAGLGSLSRKITQRNEKITRLGDQLRIANGFLTVMISGRRAPFHGHVYHCLPQHPPMPAQISLQQAQRPTVQDFSNGRYHSMPHQPSSAPQRGDEHWGNQHRMESGNSLVQCSSYDVGSSSHGSPLLVDYWRQDSAQVNRYSYHTDHTTPYPSEILRSNTIPLMRQHHEEVPHHHRSQSEGVQGRYPDPYFPNMHI